MELTGTGKRKPVRPGNWRDARLDVTSPSAVRTFLEQRKPGAVFYVSYDRADPAITVEGARVAAQAAAGMGARFLLTSTDLVFDGRTGNYNENMPALPILPYGTMKIQAEAAVKDVAPNAVILRPALMTGESGTMLRPQFECSSLVRGLPTNLFTDEWRSPVHVDDVARACWDLISLDVSGVYHLGGPERLSRFELGRIVCSLYGLDASLVREAKRPDDRPRDTTLDSSRLTTLLGWTPRTLSAIGSDALGAAVA